MRFSLMVGCLVAAGAAGAQSPAPDTSDFIARGTLAMRADSVLRAAEAKGFGGVVLVVHNGEVVLKGGYGLADRARKIRLTGASVVPLHSVTKAFTAAAILQLSERGALSLTDSLPKFLPNVPADKRAITVGQLLQHRSGLDNYLGGDYDVVSRDAMVQHALALPMKFTPGAAQEYSNAGYSLLAVIIENVSGIPFEQYVRDRVLLPLGIRDIGSVLPKFDSRRVMNEYRVGAELTSSPLDRLELDGPSWNLRGAGGFLSTVSDLYRFFDAIRHERIVRAASWTQSQTPAIIAGVNNFGMFLYQPDPKTGYDLVVASNVAVEPTQRVVGELRAVFGMTVPTMRPGNASSGTTTITTAGPGSARVPQPGPAVVAISMPDTPAGRRAQSWFKNFAAGEDAMRKMYADEFVPNPGRTTEQRLEGYRDAKEQAGFLIPLEILESSATVIKVRARSGRGDSTVTLTIEEGGTHRVVGVRVE